MINKFTPDLCKRLGNYVYRLIDPRTGQTFYVGKGKDNRVFAHVKDALQNYEGKDYWEKGEDETSVKIKQIRDIRQAGLEVVMVIHRWGMDKNTAFEVESALIDCYSGLTNYQSGHNSERGVANVETIQRVFGLKEFDDSKAAKKEYMIIKIKQEVLNSRLGNVYDTARRAWQVNPQNAQKYKYILVSLYGEVIAIYKNVTWYESTTEPGRWEFQAEEVNTVDDAQIIDRYLHKSLPERYVKKGMARPTLYQS